MPTRYLVTIFLLEEFEVGVGNVYSKLFMIVRPEYQWQYLNPTHGEVYNIQHYVIKFVSDLRQVCGFLQVLWFPPPLKLTATI